MPAKTYVITRTTTTTVFNGQLDHETRQIAKALLKANFFILAIKYLRRETGEDLYVAKKLTEALRDELEAGSSIFD